MFDISQLVSSMGAGGVFDITTLQNFVGNPPDGSELLDMYPSIGSQTLYEGVFDSSTLVSGLGVAASDVPQSPSYEVFQGLYDMQTEHEQAEANCLDDAKADLIAEKERVFGQYHYEFDESGNPVVDEETGQNKLFEGAETNEQRASRLTWEDNQELALEATQDAEMQAFKESSDARLNAAQEAYAANPSDPDVLLNLQTVTEEVSAEEYELTMKQTQEDLILNIEGLPDLGTRVENTIQVVDPETGEITEQTEVTYSGTLTEYAESRFNGYKTLVDENNTAEAESSENLAITGFYDELSCFIQNQQAQLTEIQTSTGSTGTMSFEDLQNVVYNQINENGF